MIDKALKQWTLYFWYRDSRDRHEYVITGYGDAVPGVFYYEINELTVYIPWERIEKVVIGPIKG